MNENFLPYLRSGYWGLLPVMCVDTGRALEGHTSVTQTVVTRLEVGVRQGSWGTLESNSKLPSGLVIPKHLISSISSFKIHFLQYGLRYLEEMSLLNPEPQSQGRCVECVHSITVASSSLMTRPTPAPVFGLGMPVACCRLGGDVQNRVTDVVAGVSLKNILSRV